MRLKIIGLLLGAFVTLKANSLSLDALNDYSGLNKMKLETIKNGVAIIVYSVSKGIYEMYRHHLDPYHMAGDVMAMTHPVFGLVLIHNKDGVLDTTVHLQ